MHLDLAGGADGGGDGGAVLDEKDVFDEDNLEAENEADVDGIAMEAGRRYETNGWAAVASNVALRRIIMFVQHCVRARYCSSQCLWLLEML